LLAQDLSSSQKEKNGRKRGFGAHSDDKKNFSKQKSLRQTNGQHDGMLENR
jgi:hypothetical protein